MNLANAEKYARMCDVPLVQQYWTNPEWGDYVYVEGHGRVVVGFDWLKVTGYLVSGYPCVKFAMMTGPNVVTIDSSKLPDSLMMKSGEYIIASISKPIWQPKIEQIIEILKLHNYATSEILIKFGEDIAYGRDGYTYYKQFDHIEQKLLAWFMKKINRLYWMESKNGWCTLEQCRRIWSVEDIETEGGD